MSTDQEKVENSISNMETRVNTVQNKIEKSMTYAGQEKMRIHNHDNISPSCVKKPWCIN
jgi:hypothetical protein